MGVGFEADRAIGTGLAPFADMVVRVRCVWRERKCEVVEGRRCGELCATENSWVRAALIYRQAGAWVERGEVSGIWASTVLSWVVQPDTNFQIWLWLTLEGRDSGEFET